MENKKRRKFILTRTQTIMKKIQHARLSALIVVELVFALNIIPLLIDPYTGKIVLSQKEARTC